MMAKVRRGNDAKRLPSVKVAVVKPQPNGKGAIHIMCEAAKGRVRGFPMRLILTRGEVLRLIAELATELNDEPDE